jgi:hypothetical protein
VLRGDIKKTTKHLVTGEQIKISPRVKHLKQLKAKPTAPKIKMNLTATDEFGQTATRHSTVTLCRRLVGHQSDFKRCVWHPSRK